jgi:thiamine biosynthesis lipoprotein
MNGDYTWPSISFRAMGSDFGLWLDADPTLAGREFTQAVAMIDGLEQRMSRFRATSELNRLNESNGHPVAVSPTLYEVVRRAVEMARQTKGFFDPTLLEDLSRAGYDRSLDQIKRNGDALPSPNPNRIRRGWEGIAFCPDPMTIALPEGVRLDLGGIGKGYTAQVVADFLGKTGPCLVDAGGDIVAGDAPDGYAGWPVTIAAPLHGLNSPEGDLLGLWLRNAALATSGVDRRRWVRAGRTYHHLIDPLTGSPASSGLITVSVLHEEGHSAEALATAALVAGLAAGIDLIEAAGAGGLLVTDDGQYYLAGTLKQDGLWQLPVIGIQNDYGVAYYGQ